MRALHLSLATVAAGIALTAAPALAQRPEPGPGSTSGSAVERPSSGGSGGATAGGSGGTVASSGGGVSSPSGGGTSSSSGAALFPSAGGGAREYAPQHRGGSAGAQSSPRGGGERAAPRSGGAAGATSSSSGGSTPSRSMGTPRTNSGDQAVPTWARPSGGRPTNDTAVARTGPRPGLPGGGYPYDPYYGYGYGGYYGGYNGYYSCGYSIYGCPYGVGYGYGFGWPMMMDPMMMYGGGYGYDTYGSGYTQRYSSGEQGNLKLKIKPHDAKVYVDGYFVGTVDDMDGMFQKLALTGGRHHVEVRAEGYQTEEFDVMIAPSETTTFQGNLKKIQ